MKILVITQKIDESDDLLGFFTSWVASIAKRVDAVDVLCLAKGSHHLPENVRVFSLGKENGRPKFLQFLTVYFRLMWLLPQADGVFIHMAPEYVRAVYPFNLFLRKPIVMWYAHIKVSPLMKWAMGKVDYILTPSKESFEIDSPKVISTGHGIDVQRFTFQDIEPQLEVMAISRISRVKRIETLLQAIGILKEKGRVVSVHIYGKPARPEDAEYLKELQALTQTLGIHEQVHWKGSVSNRETPRIYGDHKVFVRLQGGGGFGKTELEAMASGTPAIVPTEVYKNDLGEFGEELFFVEDNALILSEKIASVLDWSEKKRSAYEHLAYSFVKEKHNVEHVAEKITALLRK